MPDQILYDVTMNGQTITVRSDRELTDYEAYMLAKRQMQGVPSVPMGTERYGRPISDTGEEYSDFGTRLQDLGASMAHPQTVTDFGHLLLAPTDATRTVAGMMTGANAGRQMLSDASRRVSDIVQPPISGAPSRLLEWLANRIQPPVRTSTLPSAPPTAPTVTAPSAPMPVAPASEAATQLQQSASFRNLPTTEQIWADQAPATTTQVATRVQGPLATATAKMQEAAQAVKVQLTPDELEAGARLVMEGRDPAQIVEVIARSKMPEAFQGLPTNADVETHKYFPKMGQKKARPGPPATQRPKGT